MTAVSIISAVGPVHVAVMSCMREGRRHSLDTEQMLRMESNLPQLNGSGVGSSWISLQIQLVSNHSTRTYIRVHIGTFGGPKTKVGIRR